MKLLGLLLVIVCTFGGFFLAGGKMKVITGVILPAMLGESVIILGCAISAFIVANSGEVIKDTLKSLNALVKPKAYSKKDYIELLGTLFTIFKLARTKGWLALESHIENPEESDLFNNFPTFASNHHALTFLCDYLRIVSLGNDNPHELEALMDEDIETLEHHYGHPGHAVQTMADGIPALGIVAAVLGVIKTMASISEPPEVLGKLIGSALVGTFLGVWVSYGFVGPIASALTEKADTQIMYYKCMKVGLLAFLQGAAPQVAVEFSRKFLPHDVQPSFIELEDYLNELSMPG